MGKELATGDGVPLRIQLEDGAIDKFIRATVRDDTGAQLAGSPFTVPHVETGFYYSDSLVTYPAVNNSSVTVYCEVFDDAGFSVESEHAPDGETFFLDDIASAVDELKSVAQQVDIVATVETDDLGAEIEENAEKIMEIDADVELVAAINEDQLNVSVDDDPTIDAELEC